ncbi:MAG TPA: TfoX/Sxy family protein [Thermomicrobiales bacterium]|nr:TfoX/Sxy family protein [Thermomicrobiales bacterium]
MRDDSFLEYVLDQLATAGEVAARRMFGGHGLYLDGAFFAIVSDDRLYFKTDEASREDYRARGMRPFQPSPRQTLTSYYEVPPEILDDRATLGAWARRAATARR